MRTIPVVAASITLCALVLPLAGCGDSTPLPAADSASTARSYTPSTGAFVAVPTSSSGNTLAVSTCNLDAVNDKPAGSAPLSHTTKANFSGWAAGAQTDNVPASVQLVLKGAQNYAVDAATGMPRPDVAKAGKHPGWAAAGYSVKADLSAVAPGIYSPVLEFNVGGKQMLCLTQHKLTIQ